MTSITQAEAIIHGAIVANQAIIAAHGDYSGVVIPYLEGAPGIGKTSIVGNVARSLGMQLIPVRLAEYDPTEAAGWNIPNKDHTSMTRLRPNWMPDGSVPSIVFFDELPQAPTACQNVAAQIVNERRVGPHMLPENCIVVAAGNSADQKAGTNFMPTHLRDRLTFIEVEAKLDDTLAYFSNIGIDHRIIGYLKKSPDNLSKFVKDAKACPSPRSWHRINTWLTAPGLTEGQRHISFAGTVGDQVAVDFATFIKHAEDLPDFDELVAHPTDEKKAPIHFGKHHSSVLFAVAAALAARASKENMENITKYLKRLNSKEITTFIMRDIVRKYSTSNMANREPGYTPALHWPTVADWMADEGAAIARAGD